MNTITCKCGAVIPNERITALRLTHTSPPPLCIKCASNKVERVAGFPLITGKNTYSELQLVSQSAASKLFGAQARHGQSPGAGIRMKGH